MREWDVHAAGILRTPPTSRYVCSSIKKGVYDFFVCFISCSWCGCQVIIDNMMNLELLFVSADLTGNQNYRRIAITHATTTMNNHIRPDGTRETLLFTQILSDTN